MDGYNLHPFWIAAPVIGGIVVLKIGFQGRKFDRPGLADLRADQFPSSQPPSQELKIVAGDLSICLDSDVVMDDLIG